MLPRPILTLALVALCCGVNAGGIATAQTYPAKPIKLLVPFAAGGQPDTMARIIAHRLSSTLGPVIVENRPGAGGTIGLRAAAGADPDGYTLVLGTPGGLALSPALFKNPGYDPINSFAPVAMIAAAPFVLVVGPAFSAKTLPELVAYAKANPGKLNFGAPNATPPHLACELFKRVTAIDIVHVSAKNMPQSLTDPVGGQLHLVCEATTLLLPLIEAGQVRPLAAMSVTRIPQLPDVPTTVEIGLPDLVHSAWAGVMVPADTPDAIVGRLNAEINEGLRSSEVTQSLAKLGAAPRTGSPQDFAAFIAAETKKWAEMVKLSGATAK
jgi:tripartite-type tricarboxylate transporter receptor subunit TctC